MSHKRVITNLLVMNLILKGFISMVEELEEDNDADNYRTFLSALTVLSAKFEIELTENILCPGSEGFFLF